MGLGDDGGGGPRGGRPGPHARRRARPGAGRRRRRHLPPGLRRRGQHDALVLPPPSLRPAPPAPLRPPLAGGLGGLPGLQPGHGRRRRRAGRRRRRRLRAGLPLLAAGTDAGRGAPRSAHGALLAHAVRRARHARRAARRRGGRAARRDGRLRRLRLPLPPVGGRLPGLLRRRGARCAPHVRGAARPRCRRTGGRGGVTGVHRRGGSPAGRGGRAPHHRPDGPHGALEEHRAGDARLRGAADRVPRMARAGRARGSGLSQPAGAGRVSRLQRRRRAHGGAHQPFLGVRRLDAHSALGPGRLAPLARRVDPVRRVVGQPGARRPEPGGQGGPAAEPGRRRAGAVAPGRGLGGVVPRGRRGARDQPLRRRRHGRRAARRADHGRAARAARADALRASVRGRTAADWWADQLAAAGR